MDEGRNRVPALDCARAIAGWLQRGLWALALLLCGPMAQAAPTLVLEPGFKSTALDTHVAWLEDPAASLSLTDLLHESAVPALQPLGSGNASFGFSDSAWWFRIDIRNGSQQPLDLVLRQAYPLLDHLDVQVLKGASIEHQWSTGDRMPFASRAIAYRDFLFPFILEPGGERQIWVRARSEGPVNVPLSLHTKDALLAQIAEEQLLLGVLFGSFLLLSSCILILYAFVRDRAFLYYLLYVLSYGSYMAVFNGLAYQYVAPEAPDLLGVLQVVLLALALCFLVQFARSILRTASVAPRLDRLNRVLLGGILACMIAAPFFTYAVLVKPLSVATLAAALMVLAMGVASFRSGQVSAGYFLLAWSAFLVGVAAYILKSFGVLPHNLLTQYGFQIGTLFEFLLLSVTLAVRVGELRVQSRTDTLTGLANRSRFDELINQHFAHARGHAEELALLVFDVDHFKRINDQLGHDAGDRVLRQVADILRRAMGREFEVCRYGGEEFVVVMPRTEREVAIQHAERARGAVEAQMRDLPVTISCGVACTRGRSYATPRDLFRAADSALYAAKNAGRNRCMADDQPFEFDRRAPVIG